MLAATRHRFLDDYLKIRHAGVRRLAPRRRKPGRGHLQRIHPLLHRLSAHACRNSSGSPPRRLLSDYRFARISAARARRNDGPGAPPAVPENVRFRLRYVAEHRVLRHRDARRTGPRSGNFVENLSPLVWLAMGYAPLESALARQAPALQLL